MPGKKHRIKGTQSYRIHRGKVTRYRYTSGLVSHNGRKVRQRLGFRGNKVIEVSYVPSLHERRRL